MIHLTIPIDPRTKKNSQNIFQSHKTGKRFISTSTQYKEYVKDCFFLTREKDSELQYPICGPVNVKGIFYMATRRKVDLSNLLACLDDILVEFGVLLDDNCTIVVSHDGSRVLLADEEGPRTEVFITAADCNDSMMVNKRKK